MTDTQADKAILLVVTKYMDDSESSDPGHYLIRGEALRINARGGSWSWDHGNVAITMNGGTLRVKAQVASERTHADKTTCETIVDCEGKIVMSACKHGCAFYVVERVEDERVADQLASSGYGGRWDPGVRTVRPAAA